MSAQGIKDEILNIHFSEHKVANGGVSNDSSQALALTVWLDV